MRVRGNAPAYHHAEQHSSYMPRPGIDRLREANRLAEDINRTKVLDPATGIKIDDRRVDALIDHVVAVANRPENFPEPDEWTPPQRVVWRYSKLPMHERLRVVQDLRSSPDVKAFAVVNAGRWVVPCPFPRCNSQQAASFLTRLFFCCDCANRTVNGMWVDVIWPKHYQAIEAQLDNRPLEARHWLPGESLDELAAQDVTELRRVD